MPAPRFTLALLLAATLAACSADSPHTQPPTSPEPQLTRAPEKQSPPQTAPAPTTTTKPQDWHSTFAAILTTAHQTITPAKPDWEKAQILPPEQLNEPALHIYLAGNPGKTEMLRGITDRQLAKISADLAANLPNDQITNLINATDDLRSTEARLSLAILARAADRPQIRDYWVNTHYRNGGWLAFYGLGYMTPQSAREVLTEICKKNLAENVAPGTSATALAYVGNADSLKILRNGQSRFEPANASLAAAIEVLQSRLKLSPGDQERFADEYLILARGFHLMPAYRNYARVPLIAACRVARAGEHLSADFLNWAISQNDDYEFAAYFAGISADSHAIASLLDLARTRDTAVAADALSMMNSDAARRALESLLEHDHLISCEEPIYIYRALGKIGDARSAKLLEKIAATPTHKNAPDALEALAEIKPRLAPPAP